MKNGTLYAKRIKKFTTQLTQRFGPPHVSEELTDPVRQLVISLFSCDSPELSARKAADALEKAMVDINEVRVSTNAEIARIIDPYVTNGRQCAERLRKTLNAIFRREHDITLKHLLKTGRREAKHYLEELDGLEAGPVASVLLWSLGGHGIPIYRPVLELLRSADLVDPTATLQEVQAFLERNINAADARSFCLLMAQYVQEESTSTPSKAAKPKTSAKGKSTRTAKTAKKAVASKKATNAKKTGNSTTKSKTASKKRTTSK